MVAHSSHFYFMSREKIQINQNKIFYPWQSVLIQAKWEQSKYKFKYHLHADKGFFFFIQYLEFSFRKWEVQ